VVVGSLPEEETDGPKVGLTIYLVKPEMVATFEHVVKKGRDVLPLKAPLNGEFIVFPPGARTAAWVDLVRSVLQDSSQLAELKSQSPGGLLIVRREKDTFVVSFTHAWQKLEDQWLESDFGLRVALNAIPPDKIVEIRAEQVFGNWHIASERAPRASFVDQFGVEFDRDLVATLDGVPANSPLFGKHVRGGTNMRVERSFSKLGDVLDKAATQFRSNAYKKRWPEIGNIKPVGDAGIIEKLDAKLDAEFEFGEAQKKLVLFTPAHRHGEELPLADGYVYGRISKNPEIRPYLLVGSWNDLLREQG